MKTAVRAEPARPQERRRKRRLGPSSDFPHTIRWAVAENGQGRQEITCLIVDDHEVVREGLRLSLSRAPHIRVVGEASDGATAVALAERRKPDVVIMDVRMPGMDGLEATKILTEKVPETAVLIFTAYSERSLLGRGLESGAKGYILKEAPHQTLLRAIEKVVGGEGYVDPALMPAILGVLGLALGATWLASGGLAASIAAAAGFAFYLIVTERRRHEAAEGELSAQAHFLESLVESMGAVATTLDANQILERTRKEAQRLFRAHATVLSPGESRQLAPAEHSVSFPIKIRDQEIAVLRLGRRQQFARWDVMRATLLADFAGRSLENARLLAEAQVREADRARLSDQLVTAEQEERRRL